MNTAGLQTGLTTSLMIPTIGKAIVPGSWQAGIGNSVSKLFARLPGINAQAAATASGSAALMWARPGIDALSFWGEATIYDNIYKQAQKLACELQASAAQQLLPKPAQPINTQKK
jgi:hypothetical protein